jgi:hypothetical protein
MNMRPLIKTQCQVLGCGKTYGAHGTNGKICPECRAKFIEIVRRSGKHGTDKSVEVLLTKFFKLKITIDEFEKKSTVEEQKIDENAMIPDNTVPRLYRSAKKICHVKDCGKEYVGEPVSKMCNDCRAELIRITKSYGRPVDKESMKLVVRDVFKHNMSIGEYSIELGKKCKHYIGPSDNISPVVPLSPKTPDDVLFNALGGSTPARPHVPAPQSLPRAIPTPEGESPSGLIDAMIIPFMTAIKAGNDYMVKSGRFTSPGKPFDVEGFKLEIIALIKSTIKVEVENVRKSINDLGIQDQVLASIKHDLQSMVDKAVAMRFKFMSNQYEEHLETLSKQDKQERLKDMRERDNF